MAGAAGIGARFALWYWKRRSAKPPPKMRFFAWAASIIEAKTLLALMTIKYRTAMARIETLENQMREAGIPIDSASPGGDAPSYGLPESTLLRSRTSGTKPSATTSPPPDDVPV